MAVQTPTKQTRSAAGERWTLYPVEKNPGIYRRGDPDAGPYVVVARVGRRQVKRTCRNLSEARTVQAELRTTPTANSHRKGATPFVSYALDWVASYSGAKRHKKIKEQTRADFEAMLKLPEFKEAFAGVKVREVTADHLDDYAALLEAKGLAAQTVRNRFLPVRRCLAHAKDRGHLDANPAVGYTPGAAKPTSEREVRALNDDELIAVRDAVAKRDDLPLLLLVDFLWQTGLRIGEALALDKRHLDLQRRRVKVERRIYKPKKDQPEQRAMAEPKSSYGKRLVPLSAEMAERLSAHLQDVGENTPVFRNKDGRRLTYYSARGYFARAIKKATRVSKDSTGATSIARATQVPKNSNGVESIAKLELDWVTLHTLRHTCASILFRRKVTTGRAGGLELNAKETQLWLGHHDPAYSLSTYTHFIEDDLPSADGFDAVTARLVPSKKPSLRLVSGA